MRSSRRWNGASRELARRPPQRLPRLVEVPIREQQRFLWAVAEATQTAPRGLHACLQDVHRRQVVEDDAVLAGFGGAMARCGGHHG